MTQNYILGFIICCFCYLDLGACVISSNDNNLTQAELITCLAGCTDGCNIDIQAKVSLSETIDLTGISNLTFTISGTGTLTLNGGSDLLLSVTSTLVLTSTSSNPLKTNQAANDPVITIGSTQFFESDFESIINAGGADANGVLPIELTSFTGRLKAGQVFLNWTTATELNNDYMAVEHSANGYSYQELGRVKGAGTTNEIQSYQFEHSNPVQGVNYYRLKQVDFNGRIHYHPVIVVSFDLEVEEPRVFPNPTVSALSIQFSENWINENVELALFDKTGRVLLQQKRVVNSSITTLHLDDIPKGFYFIRLTAEHKSNVVRFEKL